MDATILSGDRDLLTACDRKGYDPFAKDCKGQDHHRGLSCTDQVIEKRYQVTPPQIIELKALMGDPADNIPGILGVGEKTAIKDVCRIWLHRKCFRTSGRDLNKTGQRINEGKIMIWRR